MIFHRDAYGLPKFRERDMELRYGRHALDRAAEKGIVLPLKISLTLKSVVEIDLTEQEPKYTIRVPYNHLNDAVFVVFKSGFCKTVWLNRKTDRHGTLDKSRYSRVPQ